MNRLTLIIILVAVVAAIKVFGQATQPAPPALTENVWRTHVVPGGFTYIWNFRGDLPAGGFTLNAFGNSVPLSPSNWGTVEDIGYARALHVPENAPNGLYTLEINGVETNASIDVLAIPAPPTTRLSPSFDADSSIQAALSGGQNVVLSPGVYPITRTILRPPGLSVSGVQRDAVILVRIPSSDYGNAYFASQSASSMDCGGISDVTFDSHLCPGAIPYHGTQPENCLNFRRLKLIDSWGPWVNGSEALIEDIECVRSSLCGCPHAMIHNVSLTGAPTFGNEFILTGDQIAVVNASWTDTCRGLVIRGVTNSYLDCLDFNHLVTGNNANEVILSEDISTSPGLQNTLINYVTIRDCRGGPLQFNSVAKNNRCRHFDIADSGLVMFMGVCSDGKPADQSCNTFEQWQISGGSGWMLGTPTNSVLGNTFAGIGVIAPRVSWGNQWNQNWATYSPHPFFHVGYFPPLGVVDASNKFAADVSLYDAQGWTLK